MHPNDQTIYMVKLTDRIKQITKPYKLLTVLLLIDTILKTNSELEMPRLVFSALKHD
jgi:hypothetical protein